MAERAATPRLWLPDRPTEIAGYILEEAQPGDGARIAEILGEAIVGAYTHSGEREKSRVLVYRNESLWERKGPVYWEDHIHTIRSQDCPKEKIWVVRCHTTGQADGFAINVQDEESTLGKMDGLYVWPDQQGKGLGTLLLRQILTYNSDQGRTTYAYVTQRTPAVDFYKNAGAVVAREGLLGPAAITEQYSLSLTQCVIAFPWGSLEERERQMSAVWVLLDRPD